MGGGDHPDPLRGNAILMFVQKSRNAWRMARSARTHLALYTITLQRKEMLWGGFRKVWAICVGDIWAGFGNMIGRLSGCVLRGV